MRSRPASGRIHRATLASQVEDAMRDDIVSGQLPPAQHLRMADLAARYGVSPTPLREALQRLAAENLIRIDPRLGAFVADVSPVELHDIYFMRQLLGVVALERSIDRGDAAWEQGVREAWETFRVIERPSWSSGADPAASWSTAHRVFHRSLLAACASPWLLRFVDMLADQAERYQIVSVMSGRRHTLQEHEDIMTATLDRDIPRASAALRRHYGGTVDLIEHLSAPPTDDVGPSSADLPK
jgi:GntR family carbon starvation induced transcriptional regulator